MSITWIYIDDYIQSWIGSEIESWIEVEVTTQLMKW